MTVSMHDFSIFIDADLVVRSHVQRTTSRRLTIIYFVSCDRFASHAVPPYHQKLFAVVILVLSRLESLDFNNAAGW